MIKCLLSSLNRFLVLQSTPHKILFVCSGNTCRSPLAVAAWEAFAPPGLNAAQTRPDQPQPPIIVESAGLSAADGASASSYAIQCASAWGVDLSTHRTRLLRLDMTSDADLICAMTEAQAATICDRFAVDPGKVRLLGSFAQSTSGAIDDQVMPLLQRSGLADDMTDNAEILDPFGGSVEAYQACAAQIRRAVLGLITALHAGYL
jgi:protein-tyrosine phosphatase